VSFFSCLGWSAFIMYVATPVHRRGEWAFWALMAAAFHVVPRLVA
jgi:hypothetical protein